MTGFFNEKGHVANLPEKDSKLKDPCSDGNKAEHEIIISPDFGIVDVA